MEKRFLRSYMDLLVQTCHRRGALATGGMAALMLPPHGDSALYRTVLNTVTRQDTADLLLASVQCSHLKEVQTRGVVQAQRQALEG